MKKRIEGEEMRKINMKRCRINANRDKIIRRRCRNVPKRLKRGRETTAETHRDSNWKQQHHVVGGCFSEILFLMFVPCVQSDPDESPHIPASQLTDASKPRPRVGCVHCSLVFSVVRTAAWLLDLKVNFCFWCKPKNVDVEAAAN